MISRINISDHSRCSACQRRAVVLVANRDKSLTNDNNDLSIGAKPILSLVQIYSGKAPAERQSTSVHQHSTETREVEGGGGGCSGRELKSGEYTVQW